MASRGKRKGDGHNDGGRIGRLAANTRDYYQRIAQSLKDGFEDDDVKQIFLRNVFGQLCTEAVEVAQNQTVSIVLEKLISESTGNQLIDLLEVFSKDWEVVCHDRFASHVLQTLLIRLAAVGSLENDSDSDDKGWTLFLDLHQYIMNNLAFNMQQTYASHLVRVVLEILGGVAVSDKIIRSKVARQENRPAIQIKCKADKTLLLDTCTKIFGLKRLADHITNNLSNPVLQTALLILQTALPHVCVDVCRQVIDSCSIFVCADDQSLPPIVCHSIGSHFVEQLLTVASSDQSETDLFETILSTHCAGKLAAMATHPVANFVLQRLIKQCTSAEQFKSPIFAELLHSVEDILAHNCAGVVVCLAEGCRRFHVKQRNCVEAVLGAFHCDQPEERQKKCMQTVLSWTTYDTLYPAAETTEQSAEDGDVATEAGSSTPALAGVNIHGSLLMQQMLCFDSAHQPFIRSLLAMPASELCTVCCEPAGSYVIETFVSHTHEQNIDTFLDTLKPVMADVACHKNGSRTLEAVWKSATLRQMLAIAATLSKHESRLRGNQYGHFIWQNWALTNYSQRTKDWELAQKTAIKKRKLFTTLLETDDASTTDGKPKTKKAKH